MHSRTCEPRSGDIRIAKMSPLRGSTNFVARSYPSADALGYGDDAPPALCGAVIDDSDAQRRERPPRITRMLRRLVACALLALCLPAAARTRAVSRPDAFPAPRSVLWIAAHPDDEATPAPLLAYWCREQRARCAFLVMTRGESGPCLKPGGCEPDLATTRAAEAAAASQYFGADSILLTLPDGGGITSPAWAGDPAVVETLAAYIRAVDPELVLTFDPRHGSTCHPDHRAAGALVLEAVKRLANPPKLYLLENRVTFFMQPVAFSIQPAIVGAEAFDASATWSTVLDDMARHPSQFDQSWTNAAAAVPVSERFVFIAPAELALQQAVRDECR